LHPSLTFEHPVIGFQVSSVHSIFDGILFFPLRVFISQITLSDFYFQFFPGNFFIMPLIMAFMAHGDKIVALIASSLTPEYNVVWRGIRGLIAPDTPLSIPIQNSPLEAFVCLTLQTDRLGLRAWSYHNILVSPPIVRFLNLGLDR
jgi:hypothetical protein